MKYIIIISFLLGSLSSFSQKIGSSQNSTYALVVGISDYQDEDIPDLRFADKDALAFANFLHSPAGGSLDEDHMKVLINEQATAGQVVAALYWLIDESKAGDQVILYFSGHGDVERKIRRQLGFLLCWDAPSRVYMAGGALNVDDLKNVVSTLSTKNKARVMLITDACRVGKLSGSGIGGSQATAASLATQYANEIKILSCQPEEYSIEGEQWGGGRGAFSYHLLDGLYGLADGNEDLSVSLMELGRYLQDRVSMEVAPQSQMPMTIGNPIEKLSYVFPEILEQLKEGKKVQLQLFTSIESRGIEDDVLADLSGRRTEADSNIVEMYLAFRQSLKDKNFLCSENAFVREADKCADFYYEKLIRETKLERLHSSMRRDYAAALQDDVQQVMNSFLKMDMREITQSRKSKLEKYKRYPAYLERASQILGEQHYFFSTLMARKKIFEGILLFMENAAVSNEQETAKKINRLFHEALALEPDSPLPLFFLSRVFCRTISQLDSASYYVHKVHDLVPGWTLPLGEFAFQLTSRFRQADKAKQWLDTAMAIDSTSAYILNQYGIWFIENKQPHEAVAMFRRSISIDSTNTWYHNNIGWVYQQLGNFEESERSYKKSILLDSTNNSPYMNLGNLYFAKNDFEQAEWWYKKAITVDSTSSRIYSGLGILYSVTGRKTEALSTLAQAVKMDSTNIWALNNIGNINLELKNYTAAINAYQKILTIDSTFGYVTFAYSGLGIALEKENQLDKATTSFSKAIQIDSTNIWAMTGWAEIFFKENDLDKAEIILNKALLVDEKAPTINFSFCKLYAIKGNYQKALEALETALKNGLNDLNMIDLEPNIASLKKVPAYDALMDKYFHGQHKK